MNRLLERLTQLAGADVADWIAAEFGGQTISLPHPVWRGPMASANTTEPEAPEALEGAAMPAPAAVPHAFHVVVTPTYRFSHA